MSGFLSIEEVANLLGAFRNPPKPLSERAIQKAIKAGKYILTRQVKSDNGGGKGGLKYEIALSSLPKSAQEKYQNQQAQLALAQLNEQAKLEDIPQAEQALKDYAEQQKHRQHTKELGLSQFALLPKAKKDHAKAKQRLLLALYQFMRQTGLKKRPAMTRFCAAVNRGLGADSGLPSVALDSGIPARMTAHPSTVHPSTGSGRTESLESKLMSLDSDIDDAITLHPVVRAVIPVRYGVQQLGESTLKQWLYAYENVGIIALVDQYGKRAGQSVIAENEPLRRYVIGFMVKFPLAGASKVKAALAAQKPELDLVHERSINRFMSQWKAENAQLWVYITHPDQWKSVYMPAYGSHFEGIDRLNQLWEMDSTPWDCQLIDGRHTVLGVIDLYSRRTLYYVSKTSTAEALCRLLRRAILLWGVPESIRTDNGKDYVSFRFGGVLIELEIKQILCLPFASEEKGSVERSFRTAQHSILELLPGFSGHNVAEAQRIRGMKSFAQRIAAPDEVIEISMTAVELQATLDNWALHVYGNDQHSGLKGRTPNQQAALYSGHIRRISNERALDVLLSETAATPVIGKKCVRFNKRDSGYDGLIGWLAEQGLELSRSTVARHGNKLKKRLQQVKDSTEGARLIAQAAPDDSDLRTAAVISLVQSEMFNAMVALQELDEDTDPIERMKLLKEATSSVLSLSRASTNQKKWERDIRKQEREQVAAAVVKTAKAEGVSDETIQRIRTEVLGFTQ